MAEIISFAERQDEDDRIRFLRFSAQHPDEALDILREEYLGATDTEVLAEMRRLRKIAERH
jgi:hypothetical protein